jgi:preprotein translocase subunit SecA
VTIEKAPAMPQRRNLTTNNPGDDTGQPQQLKSTKVGRNDPCPCGSGKKYKHCHGRAEMARTG